MQKIIHNLVNQYAKENGFLPIKLINKAELSENLSYLIAKDYSEKAENLSDKTMQECYREFKKELIAQYKLIRKVIKIEFTKENPYNTSKEMFFDIENNKKLKVYIGGEKHNVTKKVNFIFRAVHDIFGHYLNKNSFSYNGEYKAYLHHKQIFTEKASKALFTETIGQNSYHKINKVYARQKAILLNDTLIKAVNNE